MVLGGSGGRELAVLFVYLDPDVLPAGFRGRSQRGAAAGEGIEDQGAGDGGSFDELLQQRHGLLVGMGEALISDLGAGDQVVRPFSREPVASLGCEDDGLMLTNSKIVPLACVFSCCDGVTVNSFSSSSASDTASILDCS